MNVFVSYSFNDSELYLLSLLLKKLRIQGHHVTTSDVYFENNEFNISNSDLFLGIVTNDSESINEVVTEWQLAKNHGVRSILLVEEGVNLNGNTVEHIRFNRHNSEPAINELFGEARKPSKKSKKSDDLSDALVGAGIIVGIAALIALLAGGGKK